MEIYTPDVIREIELFYGNLLKSRRSYATIADHLNAHAQKMYRGIEEGNEAILAEINNYHPEYLGQSILKLKTLDLTEADCRLTVACEYGFDGWEQVTGLREPYHHDFEEAVDAMLEGNMQRLRQEITHQPEIALRGSQYGHGATLLHYATSNGVEFWRQKVPACLPEMVAYLLEHGADKNATMNVYGGAYRPLELLSSGAHPKAAGIYEELRTLLNAA